MRVFLSRYMFAGSGVLGLSLLAIGCQDNKPVTPVEPVSSAAFRSFTDDYFNALFASSPTAGTATGLHEYDDKLDDLSAAAVKAREVLLKSQLAHLDALRAEKLNADESIDAEILDGQIKSEILSIDTLQTWKRNPMGYASLPGGAIDLLIKRDFAPAPERLRSVIARLRLIPGIAKAMKENIENPAKEFTDLALLSAQGSIGFFEKTLVDWAKTAAGQDSGLSKQFETANMGALTALKDMVAQLQALKLKSKGPFAIGAENFSKKLQYEEMVDLPLSRVLEIGEANLQKDYNEFIETAKKIDPGKSPAQVFATLTQNYPSDATLLPNAREIVGQIADFVKAKKIVTLPSDVQPIVKETPAYASDAGFASLDSPGAYEKNAKEAFYYITPTQPGMSAKEKTQHLKAFARPVLDLISIHEAYPGHFVQFLYARQFPTKTRKIVTCGTNVEGWAHYSEQMMVEQGYGGGDPKIKLAQLSEALVRDCRYVVGIKLHTQGMTIDQGTKVFEEKAFQEHRNAFDETRRGAYNPTYLYYTLGKLQIYKLRHDLEKLQGDKFSLEQFHSNFVKQGGIPIQMIRRILLPGDTSPVL